MGECSLDHSHEDVIKKLDSQRDFLPEPLLANLRRFVNREHSQQTLNELFHLLKKYDLASPAEQAERNKKLTLLIG